MTAQMLEQIAEQVTEATVTLMRIEIPLADAIRNQAQSVQNVTDELK